MRWLKVLWYLFARPLENSKLLPAAEVRALFAGLPALRERHARLLREMRAVRRQAVAEVAEVAGAVHRTLSEPAYCRAVARFCRGQRRALDSLREKRRKAKDLHQFLQAQEQLPSCARLQLRDLLACVWQRL